MNLISLILRKLCIWDMLNLLIIETKMIYKDKDISIHQLGLHWTHIYVTIAYLLCMHMQVCDDVKVCINVGVCTGIDTFMCVYEKNRHQTLDSYFRMSLFSAISSITS